jgi:hypothetical protein
MGTPPALCPQQQVGMNEEPKVKGGRTRCLHPFESINSLATTTILAKVSRNRLRVIYRNALLTRLIGVHSGSYSPTLGAHCRIERRLSVLIPLTPLSTRKRSSQLLAADGTMLNLPVTPRHRLNRGVTSW